MLDELCTTWLGNEAGSTTYDNLAFKDSRYFFTDRVDMIHACGSLRDGVLPKQEVAKRKTH
jgi:hypothetical protein